MKFIKRLSISYMIIATLFFVSANFAKTMISFMGAPGSGKGTLASRCMNELHFGSLSVGNILREEISKGTPLGKKVECINHGKFASDELVIEVVDKWLNENFGTIETLILDGFPRTSHQAELFLELLAKHFKDVSLRVINLCASDVTVTRRIVNRLVCEKCQAPTSQALQNDASISTCSICGGNLIKRADDKAEVIHGRLEVYAHHAEALNAVYDKAGIKIDEIDVNDKNPEEIFQEFKELVK